VVPSYSRCYYIPPQLECISTGCRAVLPNEVNLQSVIVKYNITDCNAISNADYIKYYNHLRRDTAKVIDIFITYMLELSSETNFMSKLNRMIANREYFKLVLPSDLVLILGFFLLFCGCLVPILKPHVGGIVLGFNGFLLLLWGYYLAPNQAPVEIY
jgi:hypothetical protein